MQLRTKIVPWVQHIFTGAIPVLILLRVLQVLQSKFRPPDGFRGSGYSSGGSMSDMPQEVFP